MPKKLRPKLGQHFLARPDYRRRIVEALPVRPDDLVIEIGAGRGAMTGLLAQRARGVVAVEIDPRLAEELRRQFGGAGRIEIVQADVLSLDFADLCRSHGTEQSYVFGNLPYYITSPILHHLLGFAPAIRSMAFVVQREVALRIAAKPASRAYGYLSVLAQAHSTPAVVFSIPPGAFSPPPAVSSALIRFDMGGPLSRWDAARRQQFLNLVKLGFARKRKTLANNLAAQYSQARLRDIFRQLGLSDNVRAEQLSVDAFAQLFDALAEN